MPVKRVSGLIGVDIYDSRAHKIGSVQDVIIDLQKGEVSRLSLVPIRASNRDDAARLFREHTVLYRNVKAAEKIIITTDSPAVDGAEEEPAPQPEAPKPYSSMRYRYLKK